MSRLRLDDITENSVLAFLDQLESVRGNSVATRNSRLTAIRNFCRYLIRKDTTNAAEYGLILSLRNEESHRYGRRTGRRSHLRGHLLSQRNARPDTDARTCRPARILRGIADGLWRFGSGRREAWQPINVDDQIDPVKSTVYSFNRWRKPGCPRAIN